MYAHFSEVSETVRRFVGFMFAPQDRSILSIKAVK